MNHAERGKDAGPSWVSQEDCLQHPLLRFGDNVWSIGDAVEGTQVFGGTGSGKTSGSGLAIARAFIESGFGGLVLTTKPDDLAQWVNYLRAAGCTDEEICRRIIVVEPPDSSHVGVVRPKATKDGQPTSAATKEPLPLSICNRFNFLEYEYEVGTKFTQEIVSLFLTTMSPEGGAVSKSEPYWDEALRELITHAVDLAILGTQEEGGRAKLQLKDLVDIIRTAPQSPAEALSSTWRNVEKSRCWYLITLATRAAKRKGEMPAGRVEDLAQTIDYWLGNFPALSDRVRSVIVSSFTAKAAGLLRYPLSELLCGSTDAPSTARPELTHAGKIVILNLPVKIYGEVGRFAQTIWKTIWQRATERRIGVLDTDWRNQRPVFLWADEAQFFLTRDDALFQQTARSALAATVYLTQNISNYYARLGGDTGRTATDSLLGNLQTKIFHANGDPATNEWAERLFAKHWVKILSQGTTTSMNYGGTPSGQVSHSSQAPPQFVAVVEARDFLLLANGGKWYSNMVEAIIAKASRRWRERDAAGNPTSEERPSAEYVAVLRHIFVQYTTQ